MHESRGGQNRGIFGTEIPTLRKSQPDEERLEACQLAVSEKKFLLIRK